MTRRTVMISSTARDLPEHREQVRLACERAGFAPHDMMEHLTALNADAIDVSLKMVTEADVYLGIFAYRYGYVPDGHKISITEMEYNRAVELNKPRLIFFIHEDHTVTGRDFETGVGATKLQTLKDRIGKARVAAFFKSPADLRADVVEALNKLAKELETAATGEAAAAITVAKLHRKTSIPALPEPYIAHPYTLLQLRDLVGRQGELNALTDWVAKSDSKIFDARIFCLVAIGGMGKSALTWKWFSQIAPNEMKPLAGRMWWSFYESDATFENFLNRSLCYVSGQSEDEVRALPWHEREAQLLQHLNEKPYLLALDGLERVLIAYNRMDASSFADHDYDKLTANIVAGAAGLPSTAAQSFIGQHRLRQATDPRAGAFLKNLTHIAASRILITSRLYPSELQLPTLDPRPGCFALFLKGLTDDDTLGLWRALKVSGSQQDLVPIFRSIENHPLLVQALASEVANYKKAPGNFARWRLDHPHFDPTSLPLVQSRTQILDYALRGLTKRVRQVLHTLVGFRMPASYSTLEALLVGPDKACHSAQVLDRALTELEDRGLVGWDREANRYDAHPIVRGVVWQLTDTKDQRAVYTALEEHFESMASVRSEKIESLADLTPEIELYHTLLGLQRYDDAIKLLRDRLFSTAFHLLGAVQDAMAWLTRLYPNGETGESALSNSGDQIYALTGLAGTFYFSGQLSRAVPIYRRVAELGEQDNALTTEEKINLSINLGYTLVAIGSLREAAGTFLKALSLSRTTSLLDSDCTAPIGRLFGLLGNFSLSTIALKRAQHSAVAEHNSWRLREICSYIAEQSLWLGDTFTAVTLTELVDKTVTPDIARWNVIQWIFRRGKIARTVGELTRADEYLHDALTRARAVNMVELELPTLIEIAELKILHCDLTEARAHIDNVWEAAERGPYPLLQADAYNVLADICLKEGDKPAAIDAATKAYRAAWCDGPPYAYHWGLQKAKAHLAALGAPEPDMPPFDESKFEPLPEVEINPKDKNWVDPDKLD